MNPAVCPGVVTTGYSDSDYSDSQQWQLINRKQLEQIDQDQLTTHKEYIEEAVNHHVTISNGNSNKQTTSASTTKQDAIMEDVDSGKPNFSKIYKYMGSLLDPSCSGHVEALEEMPTADRSIILALMRNLEQNLSNDAFADSNNPYLPPKDKVPDDEGPQLRLAPHPFVMYPYPSMMHGAPHMAAVAPAHGDAKVKVAKEKGDQEGNVSDSEAAEMASYEYPSAQIMGGYMPYPYPYFAQAEPNVDVTPGVALPPAVQ